jgi:hypothetical protein
VVRLVEAETGRVLTALEPPDPSRVNAMSFSRDGRYLAVPQGDQRVHIWDLAAIRRELEALGLAAGIPDLFRGAERRLLGPRSTASRSRAPTLRGSSR